MLYMGIQEQPHTLIPTLFGSLFMASKCCHYAMVETASDLKLLLSSKLDICKVFEPIDMLSMSIG